MSTMQAVISQADQVARGSILLNSHTRLISSIIRVIADDECTDVHDVMCVAEKPKKRVRKCSRRQKQKHQKAKIQEEEKKEPYVCDKVKE